MVTMNKNASYEAKCGIYRVVEAKLISPKAGSKKNEYVQFSLKKVKKNGRVDILGFSHFFNIGLPELVPLYKEAGVTPDGISKENLKKGLDDYASGESEAPFEFYGFFWTQEFGGTYKHKETGKLASETLVFVPCDEDTSVPKPEFCITAARVAEILQNYDRVDTAAASDTSVAGSDAGAANSADYEAFQKFLAARGEAAPNPAQ